MKELSIEEKAKAYDEVREKIALRFGSNVAEEIFSEFEMNEDERIRKELISFLQLPHPQFVGKRKQEKWIAWLEKQGEQNPKYFELKAGHWYICHRAFCCRADHLTVKEGERFMCEKDGVVKGFLIKDPEKYFKEVCAPAPIEDEQKPTDKVEPKFQNGQWIVWQDKCYKVNYNGCGYELVNQNGLNTSLEYEIIDENAHLWDITKDAKDGDVLSFNDCHGNDCIELIKSITGNKIEFWFRLINGNRYEVFDGITPYTNFSSREDATPATKEQREKLEKAMLDAGYEWDADKKELKKIGQNPTWSEEDEKMLNDAIGAIGAADYYAYDDKQEIENWLRTLKERMKGE